MGSNERTEVVRESVDLIDLERESEDRLAAMVRLQREFRERVNPGCGQFDFSEALTDTEAVICEHQVREYAECLIMEACELKDWTRWKHWSKQLGNKRDVVPGSLTHIREMRVEVADLFCFLLNAAAALGMGADEIFEFYCEKKGVNHARQNSGSY